MPSRQIFILILLLLALGLSVQAQQTNNLLQNPSFEQPPQYIRQDEGDNALLHIPAGWGGFSRKSPRTANWMNNVPNGYPETRAAYRYDGNYSLNIGRGDATFTVFVHQVVNGINANTSLRFTVWVFQDSETGSGSQTRVGIGSNVGTNPDGSPITWSPWMTAIDSWQQVTIDATVPAGTVTVFIHSTQSQPKSQNQNFYDNASLVVTNGAPPIGTGQASGTPNVPPPPTSTPIQLAPSVNAQPTQESGRIEHTVGSGDTLAAISVAYGVPVSEILQLNNLTNEQARFIRPGQVLLISEGNPNPPTDIPLPTATIDAQVATTEEGAAPTEEGAAPTEGNGFQAPTEQQQEPSVTATDAPTNTPESSPTPTDIPASPTDAPAAPVEEGEENDPVEVDPGVCLIMFADGNGNNLQDNGEEALEGGTIAINDASGNNAVTYITDGSEPECISDLPTGVYTVRATAPDGFGLPRSILSLSVQADTQFTLSFAAIEGLQVAVVPTASTSNEEPEVIEESPAANDNFRNIAGIIVLGLAGVVLVGGVGVGFILSRRK